MAVSAPTQNFKNPTSCTAAFGRFFYAVESTVYFTQVILTSKDAGRCYQVNDPTSEEIPDLLDTDGGVIQLDEAVEIQAMRPFRSGIIVFASNGVWYIYNPDGGFKATAFNVTKVSDRGVDSIRSIVSAEGAMFYFSSSGIMQITAIEFDNLVAEDITESTIRSHYLEYLFDKNCQSVYNESKKQIEWWTPEQGSRGLIYDLSLQAFYPQLNASDYRISSPIVINNQRYLPCWEYDGQLTYGLADTTNEEFKDFGIDQSAYLVSGWETLGKFANNKSITQAKVFFRKTETQITGFNGSSYTFDKPSSCLFQARWDFDNSGAYSKWVGRTTNNGGKGKKVELYKPMQRGFLPDSYPYDFDTGESLITKKVNIRGNGDAVQFLFEAQPEKDMQLAGYSTMYTMRGRI